MYVNEPVIVEYRIFTRVSVEGYSVTRQPGTAGFWVEELTDPQAPVEQVVRNGLQYSSAVVRRVALFPASAGTKTLEPLTLEAQVRMRRTSRSRFGDPFGDLFGGGLFGTRVRRSGPTRSRSRCSRSPRGNPTRSPGWSDGSTSGPRSTGPRPRPTTPSPIDSWRPGPATSGPCPEPELGFPPDFEVYPPDVTERVEPNDDGVRGSKIFEYVVVPRAPGPVTIPAVGWVYFDIDAEAYAVAASDPISLTIAGDPTEAPAGPAGRLRTGVDSRTAGHPVHPDSRCPASARSAARSIRSVQFWTMVVVPMIAVAGAVAARRHQDRLTGDVAYARRRRASRLARQRLARAESLRSPDRHREFHAEVGRALQGFLGDKLNVAEAGLIRDEIRARLTSRGVAGEVVDAYLGCLERCDRQRFAPTEPDAAAMQEMLTRAGQAMTDLDQAL